MRKILLFLFLISTTLSLAQFRVNGEWRPSDSGWTGSWGTVVTFDINGDNHSKIIKASDYWLKFKITDETTWYGGSANSGSGNVTYYGNGNSPGTDISVELVKDAYYLFTFHNNSSSSYFWTIEKINSMSVWKKNITDNSDELTNSMTVDVSDASKYYFLSMGVTESKLYQFAFLPNGSWSSNNGAGTNFNVSIVDFWLNDGSGYHDNGQSHKIQIASTSGTSYNLGVVIDTRAYEISTSALALPVELTSFIGTFEDNVVLLEWETATEVNNFGFEVKRSNDGKSWMTLDFVDGNGNSNSPKYYSFIDREVLSGKYYYRLKQIDTDGAYEYSPTIEVETGEVPEKLILEQNYPNPFNPVTSIRFTVEEASFVTLSVYNVIGDKVASLFKDNAEPGQVYDVQFDGSGLASGIYFYRLNTNMDVKIKKMILMK